MARGWHTFNGTTRGGVYVLYRKNRIIYVGRASNLKVRLACHASAIWFDGAKVKTIDDKWKQKAIERRLLYRLRPEQNAVLPSSLSAVNWYREGSHLVSARGGTDV